MIKTAKEIRAEIDANAKRLVVAADWHLKHIEADNATQEQKEYAFQMLEKIRLMSLGRLRVDMDVCYDIEIG